MTPLAIKQFQARGPKGRGRIGLTHDPTVSLHYAGELIAAFIKRAGGNVGGRITVGPVPDSLALSMFTVSRAPSRGSSPRCSAPQTTKSLTRFSWR